MAGLKEVLLVCNDKNPSKNIVFDKKYYYLMILVDNSKRLMEWPHYESLNVMASQKCY